ncbi:MAG: Holliday junction branch migration protein RuvA [Thermovirgaceae bacterium]|nr:Holliday junction branch migration protein RuvA [Synergistales bacterium]HPC75143.1 Holliday junction branch migration protein RuvA [Synergistales bacterium]HRS48385.1 Holliday junction branch migration protein RuvA [Thermovirgaceae bacterium]HRU90385.1 Holliday junction branch migration protein RuvA [Thermovirgaceae bacterium]
MTLLHSLEGVISGISPDGIDLEVGGLGFFLLCSKSVLRDAVSGQRMKVLTSLQVSESGPLLFGFSDEEERVLFQLLLKVRGIGPRLATTILRTLDFSDIINAIATGNSHLLCQVPGVGKKTSERLCFELRQQIEHSGFKSLVSTVSPESADTVQFVYEALSSLGFTRSEARPALAKILALKDPEGPEQLLRDALGELRKS